MQIIYFDLCAIPIFATVLFAVYLKHMTKGLANRLFLSAVWLSVISAVSDVVMYYVLLDPPLSKAAVAVGTLCSYVYKLSRSFTNLIYLLFLFAITRTVYRLRERNWFFLLLIPTGLVVVAILQNLFNGSIFTVTAENGYHRGPFIWILYALSTLYGLFGVIYLIECRRFIHIGKMLALISMYALTVAGIIIQFIFPEMALEMFTTSLAFLMIILVVLRPEDQMDSAVQIYSWKAYKNELKKIIFTKQKEQIVVIRFINAGEIRNFLGEEVYYSYISLIAREIEQFSKREKIHTELYFEHPGTIYAIVDDLDYVMSEGIPRFAEAVGEKTVIFDEAGARLLPRICYIRFPQDLKTFTDIIHLGHEFHGLVPYGQVVTAAEDVIGSKNYEIESNIDGILSSAIAGRALEMYFQPIYHVKENRFHSAEALIRLCDSRFGFIPPDIFIPAAESRGLILPIGDFVLESVFRFISEHDLKKLGIDYIEINLSVAQCLQKELPEKVRMLQTQYGVLPEQVNFEITETMYDHIGNVMEKNIRELQEMGYTFSLDDYGTGYSNIRRISQLPLKIIKLDKTIIDDMNSQDGRVIMSTTVDMMKGIHKELVAEGVEQEEDVERLRELGVDFIQGFYFARPMPQDQFLQFLNEKRDRG